MFHGNSPFGELYYTVFLRNKFRLLPPVSFHSGEDGGLNIRYLGYRHYMKVKRI